MKRWQTQIARTWCVLVACLALWLPARANAASIGPTDAMVLVAAQPALTGREIGPRATDVRDVAPRRGARKKIAARVVRIVRTSAARRACETPPRAVVRRLYLRHCTFLC